MPAVVSAKAAIPRISFTEINDFDCRIARQHHLKATYEENRAPHRVDRIHTVVTILRFVLKA